MMSNDARAPTPPAGYESDGGAPRPEAIRSRRGPSLAVAVGLVLLVACLYWAQAFLIPVALSILLTFVLSPGVRRLERFGLSRVPAVTVVIVLTFGALTAVGWIAGAQLKSLAAELPGYRDNIMQKARDLRDMGKGGALEQVQETVEEVQKEIEAGEAAAKTRKPLPVVVQQTSWRTLYLGPLMQPLASATLVLGLVIFMLAQREELRNRFIRVIGYGNLTVTTRGLEEAAQRISAYLLMQLTINSCFAVIVSLALFLIGVPYAFLWGLLSVPLLFVPVIGFWAATALPTIMALAIFPEWWWPLVVIGLFLGLKTANNMLLEPVLYGKSVGVSPVPLLIMIAFWTWLWGPIGLIAATPLTVCLVVFAKYVPQLEFIRVLLSDEPVMEASITYYQRLLAMDRDEASAIVREYAKAHPAEQVYQELFLPALSYAKEDRLDGKLGEDEERFIVESTREILETVPVEPLAESASGEFAAARLPQLCVLGCPAHDAYDELALVMLGRLLRPKCYVTEIVSADALTSEVAATVAQRNPHVVCIVALAPGGIPQARHLCKRLRRRFPQLKIAAGRWDMRGQAADGRTSLQAAGADLVGTSLSQTRDHILNLRQLVSTAEAAPALASGS